MRACSFRAVAVTALAWCALLFAVTASAAGNYSQDFQNPSTPPPGWIGVNDTFSVENGYYKSNATTQQPYRALAIYNGTTWDTNYTYSARLFSDYEADGNRVGVVFNYVDDTHYYAMTVSMRKTVNPDPASGRAEVFITNGNPNAPTLVGSYHPAAAESWPTHDTFFTVQVVRSGATTTFRVNNTVVFTTTALNGYGAGRIGLISQFNNGRFDDVSVTDSMPQTLFRSGFNPPVALTPDQCLSGKWFKSLTGSDAGFSWPPTFWTPTGSTVGPVFNTDSPCTEPLSNNVEIQLQTVAGPTGALTQVLYNKVKVWHPDDRPELSPRAGVTYQLPNGSTPATRFYLRRYLKYSATISGNWTWFTQHEYKTGCSDTLPGRIVVDYARQDDNRFRYRFRRDKVVGCTVTGPADWEVPCIVGTGAGQCPALPVGQWFYDEFYISYPDGGNGGRVQYAINGQVIFDFATTSAQPLPTLPNRIKLTPGYTNVENIGVQVDDLEVLADRPCAQFPCGAPAHVPD